MNRKVFMIMNPGQQGVNYVETVKDAYDRFKNWLKSPIGGFWQDDEILELNRPLNGCSIQSDFVFKMLELNKPDVDYSMIVFIGHGGAINGNDCIQLEDGEIIGLQYLTKSIINNNPIKRTVIVDACRNFITSEPTELFEATKRFSGDYKIDGYYCRDYYNKLIYNASYHVELLQSTKYNTCAHGSSNGTAFTDALYDTLNINAPAWNALALNDKDGENAQTLSNIIDEVKNRMQSYNQVPELTNSGNDWFPFCAIKRPTTKIINTGGSVIGIIND